MLTLKGVYCSEISLLSFLQRHAVTDLTLREIHLGGNDSFRSIFDHLCSTLDLVHLDDLWAHRRVTFRNPPFPGPGPTYARESEINDDDHDEGSNEESEHGSSHEESEHASDSHRSIDEDEDIRMSDDQYSDTGPERGEGASFLTRSGDYARKPIHLSTIHIPPSGELGHLEQARECMLLYGPPS